MEKHNNFILGIDPDMTTCSAVVMSPEGKTYVYLDRVKLPKKKAKYTQQEKLTYTSKHISYIVQRISAFNIQLGYWEVFIEHQSAAHASRAQKIRWQDLINLAHVSGIWTGALTADLGIPPQNIHIIYARDWKQQQSKWVNQRRTLDVFKMPWKKMGGMKPYPVPTDLTQIQGLFRYSKDKPNDSDFKDITDSMGIALWAFNKQVKEMKRNV